jgi:hypothetical protein
MILYVNVVELNGFGRKRPWPNLRYYPGISMKGLRKITKKISQDSRSPGPKIEAGISRIRSRSVNHSTTTLGLYSATRSVSRVWRHAYTSSDSTGMLCRKEAKHFPLQNEWETPPPPFRKRFPITFYYTLRGPWRYVQKSVQGNWAKCSQHGGRRSRKCPTL